VTWRTGDSGLRLCAARLEDAGVVQRGKYQLMSVGSCRKGGCSGACAYGVRDVLREKHGRWGLTARKRLGATAEPEYNVQLSSERGLVMESLNALLNGWLPGEAVSGEQRDSGASGGAIRRSVQEAGTGRGRGKGGRGGNGKGRGIGNRGRGRARGGAQGAMRGNGVREGRGAGGGQGRHNGRNRR